MAEATDALAAPWGGKTGFSMFDEEEVLGTFMQDQPAVLVHPRAAAANEPRLYVTVGRAPIVGTAAVVLAQGPEVQAEAKMSLLFESNAVRIMRRTSRLYILGSDADNECPICFEKLLRGQMAWRLPCFHQMHRDCAEHFFSCRRRFKPLCPLCRFEVRLGDPRALDVQEVAAEPTVAAAM